MSTTETSGAPTKGWGIDWESRATWIRFFGWGTLLACGISGAAIGSGLLVREGLGLGNEFAALAVQVFTSGLIFGGLALGATRRFLESDSPENLDTRRIIATAYCW